MHRFCYLLVTHCQFVVWPVGAVTAKERLTHVPSLPVHLFAGPRVLRLPLHPIPVLATKRSPLGYVHRITRTPQRIFEILWGLKRTILSVLLWLQADANRAQEFASEDLLS